MEPRCLLKRLRYLEAHEAALPTSGHPAADQTDGGDNDCEDDDDTDEAIARDEDKVNGSSKGRSSIFLGLTLY